MGGSGTLGTGGSVDAEGTRGMPGPPGWGTQGGGSPPGCGGGDPHAALAQRSPHGPEGPSFVTTGPTIPRAPPATGHPFPGSELQRPATTSNPHPGHAVPSLSPSQRSHRPVLVATSDPEPPAHALPSFPPQQTSHRRPEGPVLVTDSDLPPLATLSRPRHRPRYPIIVTESDAPVTMQKVPNWSPAQSSHHRPSWPQFTAPPGLCVRVSGCVSVCLGPCLCPPPPPTVSRCIPWGDSLVGWGRLRYRGGVQSCHRSCRRLPPPPVKPRGTHGCLSHMAPL